jgi:hypothetical protein
VGDTLEVEGYLQMGTGSPVNASFTLGYLGQNGNVNIDGNKITLNAVVGNVGYNQNSSTFFGAYVLALTAGNTLNFSQQTSGQNNLATPMLGSNFGAGSVIQLRATVPIAGWGSASQVSSDTTTRVVAARYITTSGLTGGRLQFNTMDFDTHAAVTTGSSWVYTAPVSGIYKIQAYLNVGTNNIGTNSLALYVNNVAVQTVGNSGITGFSNTTTQGAASVKLNAGDAFYLAIGGAPVAINNAWITVERLSGPSVTTATETVAFRRLSITGQQINTSIATYVDFPVSDFDTHAGWVSSAGTYNPATGQWSSQNPLYRAPVSGTYLINCIVAFQSAVMAGAYCAVTILKNGSAAIDGSSAPSSTSNQYASVSAGLIKLNAGDTISVFIYQDSGGNRFLQNYGTQRTQLSIVRVGN